MENRESSIRATRCMLTTYGIFLLFIVTAPIAFTIWLYQDDKATATRMTLVVGMIWIPLFLFIMTMIYEWRMCHGKFIPESSYIQWRFPARYLRRSVSDGNLADAEQWHALGPACTNDFTSSYHFGAGLQLTAEEAKKWQEPYLREQRERSKVVEMTRDENDAMRERLRLSRDEDDEKER